MDFPPEQNGRKNTLLGFAEAAEDRGQSAFESYGQEVSYTCGFHECLHLGSSVRTYLDDSSYLPIGPLASSIG